MSSTIQPIIIETNISKPNISHATNNLPIQLSDFVVDTTISASPHNQTRLLCYTEFNPSQLLPLLVIDYY